MINSFKEIFCEAVKDGLIKKEAVLSCVTWYDLAPGVLRLLLDNGKRVQHATFKWFEDALRDDAPPELQLAVRCQAEELNRLTMELLTNIKRAAKQTAEPEELEAAMLRLMLVEGKDAGLTIELLLKKLPHELKEAGPFLRAAAAEENRVIAGESHSRSKTNGSARISALKLIRTEDRTVPFVEQIAAYVYGGPLTVSKPHWLTDYVSPLNNLRTVGGLIDHEWQRGARAIGFPGLVDGIMDGLEERRSAWLAANPGASSDDAEAAMLKDAFKRLKSARASLRAGAESAGDQVSCTDSRVRVVRWLTRPTTSGCRR